MVKIIHFISLTFFLAATNISLGSVPTHTNLDYIVCFTPQEDCTGLIVKAINGAKKSIYVQAYSFTSVPIMRALALANKRGVLVEVLLDKSQASLRNFSSADYFVVNKIPVWIDYKPEIAHNKVIIVDRSVVMTGSFNFTQAAQFRNAENLLIITNNSLAEKYFDNWNDRFTHSETLNQFQIRAQYKVTLKSKRHLRLKRV